MYQEVRACANILAWSRRARCSAASRAISGAAAAARLPAGGFCDESRKHASTSRPPWPSRIQDARIAARRFAPVGVGEVGTPRSRRTDAPAAGSPHVARADCVCRLFHETPPPPAPPSVCEQALRLRAAARGRPPAAALPGGVTAWTQARLLAEVDVVLPADLPLRTAHHIGEALQMKLEQLEEVQRSLCLPLRGGVPRLPGQVLSLLPPPPAAGWPEEFALQSAVSDARFEPAPLALAEH